MTGNDQLKLDIEVIAGTPAGIAFFQYLAQRCGASQTSLARNLQTGEFLHDAIIYNEANRQIWLELRQLIPHEKLVQIELPLNKEPKQCQPKQQETQSQESKKRIRAEAVRIVDKQIQTRRKVKQQAETQLEPEDLGV